MSVGREREDKCSGKSMHVDSPRLYRYEYVHALQENRIRDFSLIFIPSPNTQK